MKIYYFCLLMDLGRKAITGKPKGIKPALIKYVLRSPIVSPNLPTRNNDKPFITKKKNI